MIRFLLLLIILVAAVVAQTTLADLASIGPARPDLLIALAVYLALTFDLREVFVPIWGLGIFRDAFSQAPVGMYGLIFLGMGLLVSYIRQYALRDNPVVIMFVAAFAVVLCETAGLAVLSLKCGAPATSRMLTDSLFCGLYTSIVASLLPRFLGRPCTWMGLGRL